MKKILFAILGVFISSAALFAQQQQVSPEDKEKKMDEFIQKEVERLEGALKLEDWQVFYTDSILNHDYRAMQVELEGLMEAKVSNPDLYTKARDKWAEQIYNSMNRILDKEQWQKYLKGGAGREKKAREKRKAKASEATASMPMENNPWTP